MGQGEMTSVNRVVFHIVAPLWPKPKDQRLPPMLRSSQPASVPGYSKGAWGLSVLLRVDGIFTATSISPSLRLRQRPSRYAVHARRNLPDKELRYLRTVIVTAAVYRGFGRQLLLRSSASLTYRHRAGVRLYTSSCELAESCVFDKQSLEPILCGSPVAEGAPLVPKVRGHFAEFLHEGSPERLRILA